MKPAEQAFAKHLAIIVHNYLLEWRMEDLAQQFAANCPLLQNEEQMQNHGLLSIIPYQRLHDAMWEYTQLLNTMRQTIQAYHTTVPIPFGATAWDKIKFIIDFLNMRADANDVQIVESNDVQIIEPNGVQIVESNDVQIIEPNGVQTVVPNTVRSAEPAPGPSTARNGSISARRDRANGVEVYQPAVLPASPLEPDVQLPPAGQSTRNTAEQNSTEPSMLMYDVVDDEAGPEIKRMLMPIDDPDDQQLQQARSEEDEPTISYLAVYEDGETLELNAAQLVSLNQQELEAALTRLRTLNPSIEFEKPIIQPPPSDEESDVEFNLEPAPTQSLQDEKNATVQVHPGPAGPLLPSRPTAVMDVPMQTTDGTATQPLPTRELVIPVLEPLRTEPSSSRKNRSVDTRTPDDDAMAEWRRTRGVTKANFDNHIRMLNYQAELDTKAKAAKQKQAAVKVRTVVKTDSTPTKRPGRPGRGGSKKKKKTTGERGTPAQKRQAAIEQTRTALNDSDTSDFASSGDEDADVRQMYENVKRYRKQSKKRAAKERKANQPVAQSSSSPSTSMSPRCRQNLMPCSTPPKGKPGRKPRKRAMCIPAVTPQKRNKRSPTVEVTVQETTPTATTSRRAGGVAKSAKKQATPNASKNHRPVRACTVNRKGMAEPIWEDEMPEGGGTVAKHDSPDAAKMCPVGTEPAEDNLTDTGTQDEAAIDAVLAKLHGEY